MGELEERDGIGEERRGPGRPKGSKDKRPRKGVRGPGRPPGSKNKRPPGRPKGWRKKRKRGPKPKVRKRLPRRGVPRGSQTFLPYEEAKEYVRRVGIRTAREYRRWYDEVRPLFLPSRPYRVKSYPNPFSWNDFLGTTNSFEEWKLRNMNRKPRVYRPYWEAVRYVQRLCRDNGIETMVGWREYYDEHKGELPDDIPKYPQQVYEEWHQGEDSHRVWLGLDVVSRIKVEREEVGVLVLSREEGQPSNVIRIKVYRDGYSSVPSEVLGRVIKVFRYRGEDIGGVLGNNGVDQGGGLWLVYNVHNLIWELSERLDFV